METCHIGGLLHAWSTIDNSIKFKVNSIKLDTRFKKQTIGCHRFYTRGSSQFTFSGWTEPKKAPNETGACV